MLRHLFVSLILLLSINLHAADYNGYLQMLADFTPYMVNNFVPLDTVNSQGDKLATFRGENTFGNNEQGVRHNADLSMVCAFLCKYAHRDVRLPKGVTWNQLEKMAMQTLVYAYSTHKANRLYPCRDGHFWGSVSRHDYSWESSLWAMSVAYSAFFQWNKLSAEQRQCVYRLLKAECNYELQRSIPTAFQGDTKAEENGWECDVLAVTLALFPDDPLASKWFDRLRTFAVNTCSHPADRVNHTVIDPDYDQTTVSQLFRGANLFDDYTLQNHNYFHTSYQNVVIQELGEALLALRLIQPELHHTERWHTNALLHNCQQIEDEVLDWLALPDGELAMPNGNDWSMFLYDQLTSFSTLACFLSDSDALMLERQAAEQIRCRQRTTTDGSWLLRPDVGARRMGVEAHRVMMSWLMHHVSPTAHIAPTSWTAFAEAHQGVKYFSSQDVVRILTPTYFACFSWSRGLKDYTGYFVPVNGMKSAANNNLIVPFRYANTGNMLGWYEVEGRHVNAVDAGHTVRVPSADASDTLLVLHGDLILCDSTLRQRYAIAYMSDCIVVSDTVTALRSAVVTCSCGGTLALSVDPFTRTHRSLGYGMTTGTTVSSGKPLLRIKTSELTVDSLLQVTTGDNTVMAFGGQHNNHSVLTALLHPYYSDKSRQVERGEVVDCRRICYRFADSFTSISNGRK